VSLPVSLRRRAEADLADAFRWYEARLPGLGEALLRAVEQSFPYAVFYVVREDRIDVLAVYHARRRPRAFEA
jgi:plasmid stabilization system protein ParE